MSDPKENEEAGRDVPLAVEESQLVDSQVQVQPEASSAPVPVEETSNHVENGKVESHAEDRGVKPEAISEAIPQQDVQTSLHLVSVDANAQILNKTECEHATELKIEDEECPQSNTVIENDATVHQNNVATAKTVVEVKPGACEVADSKTCNDGDPIPSSHNEPTMPQVVPVDAKAEIKNGLDIENKSYEKQGAESADNGNSISKHMFFLDPEHSYDGNESGTDEEQSAFMKELENFFRERSMEFKPPKFYGEGLNCLK